MPGGRYRRDTNVCGSATLLRAITRSKPIPFVFSSTCATYGVPDQVPIPEGHPQRPINPYGFTKYVVERILADLDHAHIALEYQSGSSSRWLADDGRE
jgi:UDP-glucose 4-epimerase